MSGDERLRRCSGCGEHVYSIAAHTDAELLTLGSFCGYFPGETAGPPQSRRAVMMGALLTTISPLLAQDFRIRVEVRDLTKAVVPGARVTIGDRHITTGETGVAEFTGLPAGRYTVAVETTGFKTWRGTYSMGLSTVMVVPVELEVGSVGGPIHIDPRNGVIVEVRDPRRNPVGNAEVAADFGDAGKVHGVTDEKGIAHLPLLRDAECKLTVVAAGFQPWELVRPLPDSGIVRVPVHLALPTHKERVDVRPSAGRRFWSWLTSCTRT